MTEAELFDAVIQLCRLFDLWWFHSHDSRRDIYGADDYERIRAGKGWVDLVIVGRNGTLFVELKSEDGRRSQAQISWADRITRSGNTYRLWRPVDLKEGTIEKELTAIR